MQLAKITERLDYHEVSRPVDEQNDNVDAEDRQPTAEELNEVPPEFAVDCI